MKQCQTEREGEMERARENARVYVNVFANEMKAMKVLEIVFNTHRVQTHPTYI
jgi:hypothetical protein